MQYTAPHDQVLEARFAGTQGQGGIFQKLSIQFHLTSLCFLKQMPPENCLFEAVDHADKCFGTGSGKVFAIGAIFLNCCHCFRESIMIFSILAMCLALKRILCNISLNKKCLTNSITRLFLEDCLLITLTNERLSILNKTFLFVNHDPITLLLL